MVGRNASDECKFQHDAFPVYGDIITGLCTMDYRDAEGLIFYRCDFSFFLSSFLTPNLSGL